jgi:hypothetical protein
MNATILDRKELGLTAFWGKFEEESRASRPVHIRTGCKELAELPLDMRRLLALAKRRGNVSAASSAHSVLMALNPIIIREIVRAIVVLAISAVVIYLVSKKYKFKIKISPRDGIEIEGEPA